MNWLMYNPITCEVVSVTLADYRHYRQLGFVPVTAQGIQQRQADERAEKEAPKRKPQISVRTED